jgi:hypothetical protein
MPENEEEATAVYAKTGNLVHNRASDAGSGVLNFFLASATGDLGMLGLNKIEQTTTQVS